MAVLVIRPSALALLAWLPVLLLSMVVVGIIVPVNVLVSEPDVVVTGIVVFGPVLMVAITRASVRVTVDREGSMAVQNGWRVRLLAGDEVRSVETGPTGLVPGLQALHVHLDDGTTVVLRASRRLLRGRARVDRIGDRLRKRYVAPPPRPLTTPEASG
jgi:hypothetical protein